MIKRKYLLIFIALLGLSVLVFSRYLGPAGPRSSVSDQGQNSAGANKVGDQSGADGKTVKVSVSMEPKEFELLSKLAKQFSDSHEGVSIQLENVNGKDAYDKWKKASQLGEAPDLMLLDNNWVEEFAALGFLQQVDEFFTNDQQNTRIATLMNQAKWNGNIWAIPKDVDPYILAWNKTTAAQSNLDHAPETTDELLAWNKSLLNPDEGKYGVYIDPSDTYGCLALISSLTGGWMRTDKIWENEAAALKTLESFLSPGEESGQSKTIAKNFPQPGSGWSPWEQLQKGKAGALVTTVSSFRSNAKEGVALSAIPALTGKTQSVWLKGRSFVISSRTPHAKLLLDWVKDLTAPDNEIKFWTEAKVLPAQISTYTLDPLRGDEYMKSYDWLIGQGKTLPVSPDTPENIKALQDELQRLWKGEENVKQWMDQLGKEWTFPQRKP